MVPKQGRGRMILRYWPDRDLRLYPLDWTDFLCDTFMTHALDLRHHGYKFHLCCYLDVYLKGQDYNGMRLWIYSHEIFVRRAICYDVEYTPF